MNRSRASRCLLQLPLMHHFSTILGIQARLVELIPIFKMTGRMLIIVSPVLKLPMEVEKEFAVVGHDASRHGRAESRSQRHREVGLIEDGHDSL